MTWVVVVEEAVDKEGSRVGQEEAVALLLAVEEETAEEVWAVWTELVVWVVLVALVALVVLVALVAFKVLDEVE